MSDIWSAPADPDRWEPILVAAPKIALVRTRQGAKHANRARSLVVSLLLELK